jgi:hypothetical protein
MAMCHDMRRFERMAEEKKRRKNEKKVDFVVNEIEEIHLAPKMESKERARTR